MALMALPNNCLAVTLQMLSAYGGRMPEPFERWNEQLASTRWVDTHPWWYAAIVGMGSGLGAGAMYAIYRTRA